MASEVRCDESAILTRNHLFMAGQRALARLRVCFSWVSRVFSVGFPLTYWDVGLSGCLWAIIIADVVLYV